MVAEPGTVLTNSAWHYPPVVSVIQLWMAQGVGTWEERAINWPWAGAWLAILMFFYGALRAREASVAYAGVATFVVAAAPLMNTHVALAGYADLWVAGFVLMGASALAVARHNGRARGTTAVIACAIGLISLKLEGAIWAALLVALLALSHWETLDKASRRRWLVAVLALGGIGLASILVWLALNGGELPFGLRLELHWVGPPFAYAMFASGDWGLLWYLVGTGLLVVATTARGTAHGRLALYFAGLAALLLISLFSFTNAGEWAARQTALNRLLLQCAPALFLLVSSAFVGVQRRVELGVSPTQRS